MTESITLFIAYVPGDEVLREVLDRHLSMVQRCRLITSWQTHKNLPGQQWEQETTRSTYEARMILLLVCPDFLAADSLSPGVYTRTTERYRRGEAIVVPIMLIRPVDWKDEPLSTLRAFPSGGKPVVCCSNQDEGFLSGKEVGPAILADLPRTSACIQAETEDRQPSVSCRTCQTQRKQNYGTGIGDQAHVTQTFFWQETRRPR